MSDPIRVRVRTRRSLIPTAFFSILLVMAPLFGVLYWVAARRDLVPQVLAINLVLVIAGIGVLLRQLSVDTVVTASEIRGRGIFSPMVRVPLDRVAAVHLVPTYVGQATEPVTQLLVRDAEGRRLYRMRGNFWYEGDLRRVAAALPVAAVEVADPMPVREFYRAYPGSAYWFEDRPLLIGLLVAGALALAVAAIVLALRAVGIPLGIG